jgi:hypothetical protein
MALATLLCDVPSDIHLKHHFVTCKNLNFLTNLRSVSIHWYLPANSQHPPVRSVPVQSASPSHEQQCQQTYTKFNWMTVSSIVLTSQTHSCCALQDTNLSSPVHLNLGYVQFNTWTFKTLLSTQLTHDNSKNIADLTYTQLQLASISLLTAASISQLNIKQSKIKKTKHYCVMNCAF